jgi:galactokinase
MPDAAWSGRAPGRVNLIGEHVDYLGGRVLPCAIDRFLDVHGAPAPTWEVRSAVPGGVRYLRALGERLAVEPQAVTVESTVPPSAGVSSSAALLVAIAAGLRPGMDGVEAAVTCQEAEQSATGVMVGIMDQYACALGRSGFAILLDCSTLRRRYVRFPGEARIAVIDSGIQRVLAETPYNQRRQEAEARMPKRMRHVESELERVDRFAEAMERDDLGAMGELIRASHASLRDDFEVSTPAVDAIVERAWAAPGCLGARIMGAGFGGSILALVRAGHEAAFGAAMAGHDVLLCRTADGPYAR